METEKKIQKKNNFWSITNFAIGNIGHSALSMTFSTYFMVYVTTAMFTGVSNEQSAKLIGMITALIFIIRIVEIFIDPIIGNIIDNTNTRWGKFKPYLIGMGISSAILLIVLFSGIFGLSHTNPIWFTILFIPTFLIFDIFYSFRDVSYWGMVPALSENSHSRALYTAAGNFTGFGQNVVTMLIVPVVTYFTFVLSGKHEEGQSGWIVFAILIAVAAIISSLITALGTHEKDDAIRAVTKQKTSIKDMLIALKSNDQMLWTALPYLVYGFGNAATAGLMFYMFKYVMDKPELFWIAGIIPTIAGFFTSPLYPIINKWVSRKVIYAFSMCAMIVAYLMLIFSTDNLVMVIIALILYYLPQGFIFMAVLLTLTDTIEYGQLKNGARSEAVTLAIRPMLDKASSAISNGIVGWVAVAAGMTGTATAASITSGGIALFKGVAFWAGLILHIIALFIYIFKVNISEKRHAEIVNELQEKLLAEGISNEEKGAINLSKLPQYETSIVSPVSGEVVKLMDIVDEEGKKGLAGRGIAIQPRDGHIYAPFNGEIVFVFTTKHVIGIRSDNGLELLIHVGLGTEKMRGEGFISYVTAGKRVKQGDLLLDFDRKLIKQKNNSDVVVMLLTQGEQIKQIDITEKTTVSANEGLLTIKVY
jgi:lactose/raffinose/galactose permease